MDDWLGWRVEDCRGRRLGTLHEVYEDEATGVPAWFLVKVGRFTDRYVLAPPADLMAWQGRIRLPYERRTIDLAPVLPAPPPFVSAQLEAQLRRQFRLDEPTAGRFEVAARQHA